MQSEKRQLEPVGDADLVVDVAQIILDDLLGSPQLQSDLFVLETLNDQRHDAQFFRRQAIANARSDKVVVVVGHGR